MLDGFHLALAAGFADCCVTLFIFRLGSGQAALRAPDPPAPPAPSLSPGGDPGGLHLCGPLSLHVSIAGHPPAAKLGVGCGTCRPSPTRHWSRRCGSVGPAHLLGQERHTGFSFSPMCSIQMGVPLQTSDNLRITLRRAPREQDGQGSVSNAREIF